MAGARKQTIHAPIASITSPASGVCHSDDQAEREGEGVAPERDGGGVVGGEDLVGFGVWWWGWGCWDYMEGCGGGGLMRTLKDGGDGGVGGGEEEDAERGGDGGGHRESGMGGAQCGWN